MLVIVDACDGCGKSSLLDAIEEKITSSSVVRIHNGPPVRPVFDIHAQDYEDYHKYKTSYLIDRSYMSNATYSPLYDGTGPWGHIGLAGFRWVELYLAARGASAYVIDHPLEVIQRRLEERGEDYLKPEHTQQVLERFRELNKLSCLTSSLLSPQTKEELPDLAAKIVKEAAAREREARNLKNFANYIGKPKIKTLLVGDMKTPNGGKTEAAFSPEFSSSARFLLESLDADEWGTTGLCDALNTDIQALIEIVSPERVVALGERAYIKMQEQEVSAHKTAPHPREVSGDNATYSEMIYT